MLTNSCVKLQTVHSIPMTMNKDGELWAGLPAAACARVHVCRVTDELCAAPYR